MTANQSLEASYHRPTPLKSKHSSLCSYLNRETNSHPNNYTKTKGEEGPNTKALQSAAAIWPKVCICGFVLGWGSQTWPILNVDLPNTAGKGAKRLPRTTVTLCTPRLLPLNLSCCVTKVMTVSVVVNWKMENSFWLDVLSRFQTKFAFYPKIFPIRVKYENADRAV